MEIFLNLIATSFRICLYPLISTRRCLKSNESPCSADTGEQKGFLSSSRKSVWSFAGELKVVSSSDGR